MSVTLGIIKADPDCAEVEVFASNYDSETLMIEQDSDIVELSRKQIQELWKILDRFMDNG